MTASPTCSRSTKSNHVFINHMLWFKKECAHYAHARALKNPPGIKSLYCQTNVTKADERRGTLGYLKIELSLDLREILVNFYPVN